jgi:hypothetical protein
VAHPIHVAEEHKRGCSRAVAEWDGLCADHQLTFDLRHSKCTGEGMRLAEQQYAFITLYHTGTDGSIRQEYAIISFSPSQSCHPQVDGINDNGRPIFHPSVCKKEIEPSPNQSGLDVPACYSATFHEVISFL